jgi:hypothetical protein
MRIFSERGKWLPKFDLLLSFLCYPAGYMMKRIRSNGIQNFPKCKAALLTVGVFPIRKTYYEPLFDERLIKHDLFTDRFLPGIDWNIEEQLELLEAFTFADELKGIPLERKDNSHSFFINNGFFSSGDAEFWYNLIRLKKPSRLIEIGSGYSTLMAIQAIKKNQEDDETYDCKHTCIEPFENPWLDNLGVEVVRSKVEDLGVEYFTELSANDILFIDSSHVIKPQGDVLFEYLQLLPSLNSGVMVHIHDIFSPKDYTTKLIREEVKFWNEQYLMEAFLTNNPQWKIIGALNWLHHNFYDKLKTACPYLLPESEPGSFYIQKLS